MNDGDTYPSLQMVLRRGANRRVMDRWSLRLVQACDGHLTLEEVAQRLHWPLQTTRRFALRALNEHWLEPVSQKSHCSKKVRLFEFRRDLNKILRALSVTESQDIIRRASAMVRFQDNWLTFDDINSYLLAVEVNLSSLQRDKVVKDLDLLRNKYLSRSESVYNRQ